MIYRQLGARCVVQRELGTTGKPKRERQHVRQHVEAGVETIVPAVSAPRAPWSKNKLNLRAHHLIKRLEGHCQSSEVFYLVIKFVR